MNKVYQLMMHSYPILSRYVGLTKIVNSNRMITVIWYFSVYVVILGWYHCADSPPHTENSPCHYLYTFSSSSLVPSYLLFGAIPIVLKKDFGRSVSDSCLNINSPMM